MPLTEADFGIVQRFGRIHPETLDDIVDTTPTLENWSSIESIIDDMMFVTRTMAAAYDSAIFSVNRYRRKDPNAMDLPIGAAIGDPSTGLFYQGAAQDKELNDPAAHAEVMAMRNFARLTMQHLIPDDPEVDEDEAVAELARRTQLTGLTLASTLEPCPACLDELHAVGISRVVFGASRRELEESNIMKVHNLKAPDIVRTGRETGLYPFEFFKFPHPAVQAACMEIFGTFARDLETERVVFEPDIIGDSATRYGRFALLMDEQRNPIPINPDAPKRQLPEAVALYDEFLSVTDSFGGYSGVRRFDFTE